MSHTTQKSWEAYKRTKRYLAQGSTTSSKVPVFKNSEPAFNVEGDRKILISKKLAVNGGRPIRIKAWSQGTYHFKEEINSIKKVLSGAALPLARGHYVMAFRTALAETYKVKHIVTTSSGTTAIHVALAAAGVSPGDEVITSPLTDYGTIIGIFQLNAIPVFCDVVEGGLVMDAAKLESVITKRTKAIMPVHNGGYLADMPSIMKIVQKHGIKVIEDCAQSHMAKIGKTYAGCFGDFGAFSTNETKHMKTGEGGFILCRTKKDAAYADLFADKCYQRFPSAPATPAFPALNVRMSEINAAIGIEQLKKLPGWIKQRNYMGKCMEQTISRYPLIPIWRSAKAQCSYWWFAFYLDDSKTDITPEEFKHVLSAEGIPCRNRVQPFILQWEIFQSLNDNPDSFRTYRPGRLRKGAYSSICPQAQWAVENILAIPLNQHTSESEIRELERALNKIFSSIC